MNTSRRSVKPLYWLRAWNFGDLLNPILYRLITMKEAKWSDVSPKILAIGSVMSMARPRDMVWGSGCISPDTELKCDNSTEFRAVRGPYTVAVLRGHGIDIPDDIPLGDPSLLLPRFIPAAKKHRPGVVGFLPHYIDHGQIGHVPSNVLVLNPATEPIQLIEQITSCDYMVSSSLHGIAVAEAYGIPAIWVELSNNIVGGEFKFRDYYAGTGREGYPMDWKKQYFWDDARLAVDNWQPPMIDLKPLLDVCPFGE